MRILLSAIVVLVIGAGLLGCESDCEKAARLACEDSDVKACYAEILFRCAKGQ